MVNMSCEFDGISDLLNQSQACDIFNDKGHPFPQHDMTLTDRDQAFYFFHLFCAVRSGHPLDL